LETPWREWTDGRATTSFTRVRNKGAQPFIHKATRRRQHQAEQERIGRWPPARLLRLDDQPELSRQHSKFDFAGLGMRLHGRGLAGLRLGHQFSGPGRNLLVLEARGVKLILQALNRLHEKGLGFVANCRLAARIDHHLEQSLDRMLEPGQDRRGHDHAVFGDPAQISTPYAERRTLDPVRNRRGDQ
jgi:hypothetical protein